MWKARSPTTRPNNNTGAPAACASSTSGRSLAEGGDQGPLGLVFSSFLLAASPEDRGEQPRLARAKVLRLSRVQRLNPKGAAIPALVFFYLLAALH